MGLWGHAKLNAQFYIIDTFIFCLVDYPTHNLQRADNRCIRLNTTTQNLNASFVKLEFLRCAVLTSAKKLTTTASCSLISRDLRTFPLALIKEQWYHKKQRQRKGRNIKARTNLFKEEILAHKEFFLLSTKSNFVSYVPRWVGLDSQSII